MTTLMRASMQLFSRPADQCYPDIDTLHAAVLARADRSHEAEVFNADLHFTPAMTLMNDNEPLVLNDWSFGQVCSIAEAPQRYIQTLPPQLAAECLNHGLARVERPVHKLLVQETDTASPVVTSVTSSQYGRIWDHEVVSAVRDKVNSEGGWSNPPSKDPDRVGLYASDRDVFMFFVDRTRPIDINGEELYRGFFAWNSEVGRCIFGLTSFLHMRVCGNHIVWGVSNVKEVRIKHSKYAPDRAFNEAMPALKRYAESSTTELEARIKRAIDYVPARGEEETVEWLRDRRFTQAASEFAYAYATTGGEGHNTLKNGDPHLWGLAQGLTAYAKDITYTDKKVELERAVGDLLNRYPRR